MRCVIVISPLRGDTARNQRYLSACLRDCVKRGESPYASHGLLPREGVLNDDDPEERALGIRASQAWFVKADLAAIYVDFGMSDGMRADLNHAIQLGLRIDVRNLPEFVQVTAREQAIARTDQERVDG